MTNEVRRSGRWPWGSKEAILVGKIKRLLDAGFPVLEISNFLDIDEATVRKYKDIIEKQNEENKDIIEKQNEENKS
jgi:DNA-binding transcriptional MerR regulator